MSRIIILIALMGCTIPDLNSVGAVNDAGTCTVAVFPASCAEAPNIEHTLEGNLPCNTCVAYRCDCQSRIFCKVCNDGGLNNRASWGCNIPPVGHQQAWCIDLLGDAYQDAGVRP